MNPIIIKTKPGMKRLGRLIRGWSLDPASRPAGRVDRERAYVISRDKFVAALEAEGLTEGEDFEIRDGITEVELLMRQENCISLLLPEPSVLAEIAKEAGHAKVRMTSSAMYSEDLDIRTRKISGPDVFNSPDPIYELTLGGDDPFDEFLDTFMASYSVSQCR